MSRQIFADLWKVSHDKSGWYTAFGDALKDLTPQQAAWKPNPDRHSIWQIVNHVTFWREYALAKQRGEKRSDSDIAANNWPEPAEVTSDAWRSALDRFEHSRTAMHDALVDEKVPLDHLAGHVLHDVYHLGQISYLRALQGFKPVS